MKWRSGHTSALLCFYSLKNICKEQGHITGVEYTLNTVCLFFCYARYTHKFAISEEGGLQKFGGSTLTW